VPVLSDWDLTIDADRVLWGQGMDPAVIRARKPRLVTLAENAIGAGRPLLQPVVLYERLPVTGLRHERLALAGGGSLSGPLIAEHLAGASEVVLAVCTVGAEISQYVARQFDSDPAGCLALEGLAAAAAEELAETACRRFEAMARAGGLQCSIPLNPGMIGWPLQQGQEQIFSLLDAGQIGVSLGPGAIMSPLKSLSLVVGFGTDLAAAGRTCDYCSMRETCRYKDHYAADHKEHNDGHQ
jgi:hypothetical protein